MMNLHGWNQMKPVITFTVCAALTSLSAGCATITETTSAIKATVADAVGCEVNFTAAGAVAGALTAWGLGKLAQNGKEDDDRDAAYLALAGGAAGGWLGAQQDKFCHQRAVDKSRDAAVAKYEAALAEQRSMHDAALREQQAKHDRELAEAKKAKQETKTAEAKPSSSKSASASAPATPQEDKKISSIVAYEDIKWSSNESEGIIRTKAVYQDTASNQLCHTREDYGKGPEGAYKVAIKSCRGKDGTWVDQEPTRIARADDGARASADTIMG